MKTRYLFVTAVVLAVTSIGFAQAKAKAAAADEVVRNLYAVHKTGSGPFFQTKRRGLVDQYFTKDLADMIWKDAVDSAGEAGAIDFDPLYNSQDPQITNFVVARPRSDGGPDDVFVIATFRNGGNADKVEYELKRQGKSWKIAGIYYSDGEDLASTLRFAQDVETRKEWESNPYKGDYMVGAKKCTMIPTKSGFNIRIECNGEKGFKLYQFDGTETEDNLIHLDEKSVQTGKFAFKHGESSGRFIDASGKEVKVNRIK